MDFSEFRDAAFEAALRNGCSAAEVYYTTGEQFEAGALSGELESYSVSRKSGLNLRVALDGKDGYAYTEVFDDPEELVMRAMDNARAVESMDAHPMQKACGYESVDKSETPLAHMSDRDKIELALSLERALMAQDERVVRAVQCRVISARGSVHIHNTLGLAADSSDEIAMCYAVPVIQSGEQVKNGFSFRVNSEVLDIEGVARDSVKDALSKLDASPVSAGTYRVMLRREAAADLLEAFAEMFSADAVQKGLSLLAGRENERIAAECVSIVDDPFDPYNPSAFDGEGVPCRKKTVVENGVLRTLLHNLKTAKKAGVESTGNAGRSSAASPVGIMPSNFYILPGTDDYEGLIKKLYNGIIITEIAGQHAGLNTVSGDFSLLAWGLLVQDGEIVRAVDQITVGGSFLELMKNIEAVGTDTHRGMPESACFMSPSLLVSELTVSGQ